MRNLKNKLKLNKGITLIALIITIIVLLILAGVVINMALGNDGIIAKAQSAVDTYKNAQEKEEIELAKYENMIDGNRTISESDIEAVVNRMILNKYPVGSIYCSVSNVNPGTFIGGTWTKISQGRVLMGASDNAEDGFVAGTTKNAGLPNITGRIYACNNTTIGTSEDTGAFTDGGRWGKQYIQKPSSNDWEVIYDHTFNAHNSNPIYGASTTVQPPAYVVYMWQRTE